MVSTTCQRICAISFLIFGAALITLSVVGKTPLKNFIDDMIRQVSLSFICLLLFCFFGVKIPANSTLILQQITIKPGTATYDNWQIPPVPVYDDIYLFNITNPAEFNNGSKAMLDMVGPFVYR